MLKIYTDASVSNNQCVATCFSTTDKTFICYKSFEYENIMSSLHGELLGIYDGILYTLDNTDITKDITVYSDSLAAIQLINTSNYSRRTKQLNELVTNIQFLTKHHNISYEVIQGHQLEHNPNKIVDLTSNSILRFNRRQS